MSIAKVLFPILILSYILAPGAFAESSEHAQQFIHAIANEYFRSFPSESSKDNQIQSEQPSNLKTVHAFKVQLSDKHKHAVVFNEVLAHSTACCHFIEKTATILNRYAWKDLHLFYGNYECHHYHLMSRINRTITTLGEDVLAILLVRPSNNITELTERQQLISLFNQQSELVQKMQDQLATFKVQENSMLSLWSERDPLYTAAYTGYMDQKFYTKKESINQSAQSLQWRKILKRDFFDIVFKAIAEPTTGAITTGVMTLLSKRDSGFFARTYPFAIPFYNFYHTYKRKQTTGDSRLNLIHISNGLLTLHSIWDYYKGYTNYKEYADILCNLALRMHSVQTFIQVIDQINGIVQNEPTIERLYGKKITAMRALLNPAHEDHTIRALIQNLKKMPFSSWSYFFNHGGKLLASYKIFIAHKEVFHDAMYELGSLDAFLGIRTLLQETKNKGGHTYNFVKFLSRQEKSTPYIQIIDMWHPFLESTVAIGNSIEMDGKQGGMRHMILTGPNSGGKSTFVTGIADVILLSQVFGIAPAKETILTINTYMDITDDIATGKSLFMAEVDRFQQHLQMLNGLNHAAFSFSSFDEPFSGTNPTEGSATAYSILNYMAQYDNGLNIVATHYPILTLLEKKSPNKGFKNYKVVLHYEGKEKKIKYNYKIVPGKSDQASVYKSEFNLTYYKLV